MSIKLEHNLSSYHLEGSIVTSKSSIREFSLSLYAFLNEELQDDDCSLVFLSGSVVRMEDIMTLCKGT